MINFDDYLKWKESELKEYLDKQPQYRRKSIVLYQGRQFDEDAHKEIEVEQLAEVFGRSGGALLIKTECNSIYKVDITDIKPFNFNTFKYLKKERCTLSKNNPKYIKLIVSKVLRNIYPIERYDITEEIYGGDNSLVVTVHYPEIQITNSIDIKHTIRDLYIKYYFKYNNSKGIFLYTTTAAKSTYTVGELKRGYLHSHISSNGMGDWSGSFCFGRTDFATFINNAKYGNVNESTLYQLFLGMDSYLTWESLEGSPYKRINDIKEFEVSGYSVPVTTEVINKCFDDIINSLESFTYEPRVSGNNVRITVKTPIEGIVEQTIKSSKYWEDNYIVRLYNGIPVKLQDFDASNYSTDTNIFFKGQNIPLKIIKTELNDENIERMYPKGVAPELIKRVKAKLEEKFEEYLLTN